MSQIFSGNSLIFSIFLCLAACGGSSSPTGTQLISQAPLSFEQSAITISILDAAPTNALIGGSGSGAVTYSSSNESVATVDASSGAVTMVAIGSATITATKAADSNHHSASASYNLVVVKAEQEPLLFTEDLVEICIGEPVPENALQGGSGTGALVYSSSDPTVASVDVELGSVTVHSHGSVTITVTKEADAYYSENTALYTFVVYQYEQQALSFTFDQISGATTAQAPNNPLIGGECAGSLRYSSSDEAIAVVNSQTGVVTLLTSGSATITVVKEGDDVFDAHQISYGVTAFDVISDLAINVGLSDTSIEWKSQQGIIETVRTSQFNCNIDNYPGCSSTWVNTINHASATPYTDSYPKIGNLAYLHLQNEEYRSSQIRLEPMPIQIPERMSHSFVAFQDRLWIIGGMSNHFDADDEYTLVKHNDIWSSADGANWVLETDNAEFSPRSGHTVVEFNEELYLFSGFTSAESGLLVHNKDIWKSSNGVSWTLVTDHGSPIFSPEGKITALDGKLWAVTGEYWLTPRVNEVWSSGDGKNWEMEVSVMPFPMRRDFALYADNERLYLMGGASHDYDEYYLDVWASADGVQWDRVAEVGGYGAFNHGNVIQFDGDFYAIGGWSPGVDHPAFVSEDGINWSELPEPDHNKDAGRFDIVEFKGAMWLSEMEGSVRYMWTSTNGVNWRAPIDVSNVQWYARD